MATFSKEKKEEKKKNEFRERYEPFLFTTLVISKTRIKRDFPSSAVREKCESHESCTWEDQRTATSSDSRMRVTTKGIA